MITFGIIQNFTHKGKTFIFFMPCKPLSASIYIVWDHTVMFIKLRGETNEKR